MRPRRWYLFLLLGVTLGCDNEVTVVRGQTCLEACLSASAELDIDARLAIVADMREGLESGRVGLAASIDVARALTDFVQSMVDLHPSMPSGLTYEGGGLYSMQVNPDALVEMRFYLPKNTSFGVAGDLIDFNLFSASSYFVGFGVKTSASVGLSGVSTDVAFTFDSVGPAAELLGLAAGASSPVSVDVDGFARQLANVIVHTNVSVAQQSEAGQVAFSIAPISRRIGYVTNAELPLVVSGFTAVATSLDQVVSLGDVALSLTPRGAGYDGSLRLASVDPSFSFDMLFAFDASATADVVLGCPGATLIVPTL